MYAGTTYWELVDPEKSALTFQPSPYEESWKPSGFYASEHALFDGSDEVAPQLRYCPHCLKKGLHFAWQQLRWLSECPIHGQELLDRCPCGKRVHYRLSIANNGIGVLCACGELTIGIPAPLNEDEYDSRELFRKHLLQLREEFKRGFCCLRLGSTREDQYELLSTHRLTCNVLRSLVEPAGWHVRCASMEQVSGSNEYPNVGNTIKNWFTGFFNLMADHHTDDQSSEVTRFTAAALQENFFNSDVLPNTQRCLSANGKSVEASSELVRCAAMVFAERTLGGLMRERSYLMQGHKREVRDAIDAHAQPLCLVARNGVYDHSSHFVAYWPNRSSYAANPMYKWVSDLAHYLVVNVFYGPENATRRNSKLSRVLRNERNIDYFRGFDLEWSDAQMDLFPAPRRAVAGARP